MGTVNENIRKKFQRLIVLQILLYKVTCVCVVQLVRL